MDMQSSQAKLAQQAQSDAMKREHEGAMLKLKTQSEITGQKIFMAQEAGKLQVENVKGQQKVQEGREKLAQQREQGEAKLQQMKQQNKLKSSSSSGGTASKAKSSKK